MRLVAPAVVAVALLATGCSSSGDPSADPTPSAPVSSTTAPVTPTPTPTPSPSETTTATPAVQDQVEPTVELGVPADSTYVGRAGRLHVTASVQGVLALRPDGSEAWRLQAPKGSERQDGETWLLPGAGAGVVVHSAKMSMDPWPGRVLVRAVDARSGKVLWREKGASFARAGDGAVFTSFCTGEQDARIGDCTLTARDPRTGATRWSIPTYASVQVREVRSGSLVVESHPEGAVPTLQVRSTATGAALSTSLEGYPLTVVDDAFLRVGPRDRRPGNGCRSTAEGLDLAGNVLWTRTFNTGRDPVKKDRCGDLYGDSVGPAGPFTVRPFEGVERLLDPASGRTIWAGERGEEVRVINGGVLVAVQTENGWDTGSRGIDLRTGKELWVDSRDTSRSDGVSWTALGRGLLRTDERCYDTCPATVVRARTGESVLELSGEYALSGRGWVATFTDDTYDRIRVFELG